MKQKQIHAVVKYFYPVAAGIETNMLETYSVLVQRGWNVTVHTSTNTLTEENILPSAEEVRGIQVQRYRYNWWSFWPQLPWDSADVIALHNFNVIPHGFLLFYAWWRKITGKRVPVMILTPHGGYTPDWLIFHPVVAWAKRMYHATVGLWLIRMALNGIRAVSEWERLEIAGMGVRTALIRVIANGIEDEAYGNVDHEAGDRIKKRVKGFGKYLIQIGRIYDIKNYETVLQALTQMPADINFVIVGPVGSNEYLASLKRLIADLHLENRVFFAGVVRGYDKYYLIKHAAMMVHMARWESFCNAVHEGMSQARVCIVADNTALRFLVEDGINGYRVPTTDSTALANKVLYVLDKKHAAEITKITATAKKFALAHSWKNVAITIESWLIDLLSEKERK